MTLRKYWELITFLSTCSRTSFEAFKLTKSFLQVIREISYNLLYTELPLTHAEIVSLKKQKQAIKILSNKSCSIDKAQHLFSFELSKLILGPIVRIFNGGKIRSSS